MHGTLAMHQHRGQRCGQPYRASIGQAYISIRTLRPFERYIRTAIFVSGKKMRIESAAFLLKHSRTDFDAGITKHGYTAASNLDKGVNDTHDYSTKTLAYQQLGARRSFAVMRAGLKGDVNRGLLQ